MLFLVKRGQINKSRFKSEFLSRSGKDPTQIDAGFRFEIGVASSVCLILWQMGIAKLNCEKKHWLRKMSRRKAKVSRSEKPPDKRSLHVHVLLGTWYYLSMYNTCVPVWSWFMSCRISYSDYIGTMHKRRRHFFRIFYTPLPHVSRFLVYTIRWQFWPIFDPSQLPTSFMDDPFT